jgi:hypothetical protein
MLTATLTIAEALRRIHGGPGQDITTVSLASFTLAVPRGSRRRVSETTRAGPATADNGCLTRRLGASTKGVQAGSRNGWLTPARSSAQVQHRRRPNRKLPGIAL